MEHITKEQIAAFRSKVLGYYAAHMRVMPWRYPDKNGYYDPYKVLISEIMLQQTQVARVEPKYKDFLQLFPSIQSLAGADLELVLRVWNGLGYNRRAKYLWQTAQIIVTTYNGSIPRTVEQLITLPGIGRNTAGALIAYSFDMPVAFIETNIRTVYLRELMHDQTGVTDAAILELVTATLPKNNIREWYYALMDYGAFLKSSGVKAHTRAANYTKQSSFNGSLRQLRGAVLRQLSDSQESYVILEKLLPDRRLLKVLHVLTQEKMIHKKGDIYILG